MSGYNPKTGFFELTYTKARYWSRRNGSPDSMEFFAGVLRGFGLDVPSVHSAFLEVNAPQGEIFDALRNWPAVHQNGQSASPVTPVPPQ